MKEALESAVAPPVRLPEDEVPRTVHRRRRQRRPSGAPPPLPRKIGLTGAIWVGLLVYIIITTVVFLRSPFWLKVSDQVDTTMLRWLAHARTAWLTPVMRGIKAVGSGWAGSVVGLATVALLMVFRRWRHLLVFLGSVLLVEWVGGRVYDAVARPRPFGVDIIGGWGGFSMPSPPIAILAMSLVAVAYTLVVPGRPRWYAKLALLGIVAVFGLARLYLGVDHPSDVAFAVVLAVGVPVTMFRLFTPNEAFPVAYRRGNKAHVDVTGVRGDAIRRAVADQLGMSMKEIKPVGLEGSGGSTPLRLTVEGDPDTYLFAKLYTKAHMRADRSYKMWRTILYGKLEDETPFQTVRRFVEYEDYTLRVLHEAGIPSATPYGFVEITPEQEYMLVTEFFRGAEEMGDVEVDDEIIDNGLLLIRNLWDLGVAHRDIKPANLMVRDGKVLLIDVFFAQVRPSPWRQAVDLGNMMLVLACRSDPERVFRHALKFFSPDEIAEAFAATRGVASPTQLRQFMKRDGRDLLAQFRALAPKHRPIAIQRWSPRRLLLALGVAAAIVIGSLAGFSLFVPLQNIPVDVSPECRPNHAVILMAQAVPSASAIPCIATLPSGWSFGGGDIHSGAGRFWLNSDRAGFHAAAIELSASCDVTGAQRVPTDEPGTRRYEDPSSVRPRYVDVRSYVFPGGCATYAFSFAPGSPSALVFDVDAAVGFTPRASLVQFVQEQEDLALCGRGASCPG